MNSNGSFYRVNYKKTTQASRFGVGFITIFFIFLSITFLHSPANASAPMTHAYLGAKWLDKYGQSFDESQKQAFILGTLFPDIRYLIGVSREKTHIDTKSLKEVNEGKTAFEKGVRFHCYVDYKRSELMYRHPIYKEIKQLTTKHRHTFVKLVEDQITYSLANGELWQTVQNYLSDINPEEEKIADLSVLAKWHLGLSYYFSDVPSTLLSQISIFNSGILMLDAQTVNEWSKSVKEYAQKESFQKYVAELIEYIE